MSSLTSLGYTATQYALLSSAYTYVGKFAKGFSGVWVERLAAGRPLLDAYGLFFICAGLLGLPALVLCIVLAHVRERTPRSTAASCDNVQRPVTRVLTTTMIALLASALLAAAAATPPACSIPRFASAQLPTEHFVIYFHQGEERLAQRLARDCRRDVARARGRSASRRPR